MSAIKEDGVVTRNWDKVVERTKKFHEKLYCSHIDNNTLTGEEINQFSTIYPTLTVTWDYTKQSRTHHPAAEEIKSAGTRKYYTWCVKM